MTTEMWKAFYLQIANNYDIQKSDRLLDCALAWEKEASITFTKWFHQCAFFENITLPLGF